MAGFRFVALIDMPAYKPCRSQCFAFMPDADAYAYADACVRNYQHADQEIWGGMRMALKRYLFQQHFTGPSVRRWPLSVRRKTCTHKNNCSLPAGECIQKTNRR
jgi:hypothetical protein